MKRMKTMAPLLTPLLVLAGCSHTIPDSETRPTPPPQLGGTTPAVAPLDAGKKQAQAPESAIPVTLTADLTPVERVIQQAVPEQIEDADHPLAKDYRWRFVREGQPKVFIQDGLVRYQAVYRGEIESRAARACRLDPLYPVLEGTGRLTLRQHDEDVIVAMTDASSSMSMKPESDDKCNMFNVPVKDQLGELFRQDDIRQDVADAVNRAGFVIPIRFAWERLHGPVAVEVAQANKQLCLYGKVRDFTVGSLKGTASQTTIEGLARQTPTALYEATCQQPAVAPVLVKLVDAPPKPNQEGRPYKVLLSVPVPYAVLNQQLNDRLFHSEAKLPSAFLDDRLRIERVTASDANGRVLLAVETTGDVKGTIYYWGTPALEDGGRMLTLPDLQMATESKTALDGVATGYWQRVDRELREPLRKAAAFDLSQRLGDMKSALSGQHKSGGLKMDLLFNRQEPAKAYSTRDAVVADVLLQGTANASGTLPVESREAGPAGSDEASKRAEAEPQERRLP